MSSLKQKFNLAMEHQSQFQRYYAQYWWGENQEYMKIKYKRYECTDKCCYTHFPEQKYIYWIRVLDKMQIGHSKDDTLLKPLLTLCKLGVPIIFNALFSSRRSVLAY